MFNSKKLGVEKSDKAPIDFKTVNIMIVGLGSGYRPLKYSSVSSTGHMIGFWKTVPTKLEIFLQLCILRPYFLIPPYITEEMKHI